MYLRPAEAAPMQTTVTDVLSSASSIIFLIAVSPFFLASSQSEASWNPTAAVPTISPMLRI